MATALPFAQGYYLSESLPISAQECTNFYPNIPQTSTVTNQSLFGTPGLTEIATANTLNEFNRGLHVFDGIPYAVNGNNLYRIDRSFNAFGEASFNAVQVGTGIFGSERVFMSDNGPLNSGGGAGQLCIIVPESDVQFNAFIFTIAGGLVQISDVDFDGPVNGLAYVDGFFLFTKKSGNKFFISNLRDGLTYLATDFADAEVDPDPIRAPFILKNEVYIFGSQTFEPFQNVGGGGFPFVRIEGAVQDKGIDAPASVIEIDGNMSFIGSADGEQPAIWLTNGGKPQKISTTAIDNQIRQYTDETVSSAFAATYSQAGALFAVFTFPRQETFVYEVISGLWHTRESTIGEVQNPWRVSNIKQAYGELLVGDLTTNKFGIIDREIFTEYGEPIKRRFVMPPFDNGGDPFFIDSIEAVIESGLGNTVDPAQNPKVILSYSDDGGRTFSDGITREVGAIGEYEFRTIWNQLGRVARERMFKFEVADAIKWVFYKVEGNFD